MIATLGRFARERVLELAAGLAAAAFLLSGRVTWRAATRAIDSDLLFLLFALLITVEILRQSGYLDRIVAGVLTRFRHTRSFAAMLIVTAGVLASLVTNDVTLFVIIPFTVIASRLSDFDIEDAVVLEVIATNLLGCLTPLGNPQNLFLYHQSEWTPQHFIATMLPFVAWNAIGLAAALFLFGKSHAIAIAPVEMPPLRRRAALAGAVCFALVLLEVVRVIPGLIPALAAAFAGLAILRRRILLVDLSIVPLFLFAFIVVEGLRTLDLLALLSGSTYWVSIALSQVISNVPAAILLTPFADGNWRELLYGVSAGGCGTIVASLANLLGWRIYARESNRDPKFFLRLTVVNFAFLGWAALGGYLILDFGFWILD